MVILSNPQNLAIRGVLVPCDFYMISPIKTTILFRVRNIGGKNHFVHTVYWPHLIWLVLDYFVQKLSLCFIEEILVKWMALD